MGICGAIPGQTEGANNQVRVIEVLYYRSDGTRVNTVQYYYFVYLPVVSDYRLELG